MEKIKMYGAGFWGECFPVKEYLSEKGIDYDYVDIMESEENRAEFEAFRKSRTEYVDIIKGGVSFGIPVLFFNDDVVIGFKPEEIDALIAKIWKNLR